jgi:hypothetical protein
MEERAGSSIASSIQSFKAELYETLELLLSDKDFRILCKLENGVYRDVLVALLKKILRPASFEDVNDFISDLTQIGVFEVELRDVEVALPKQLFIKKRRTKKGGKKRRTKKEGVREELQIPTGFEVIGESLDGNPILLLRTYKQVLKPSRELVAVCSSLATSKS